TPIARVEIIDEANNGDDVAYDNFRFSATITPATISFSGMLKKFSDDTPVGGASVEMVGNASIKTPTAADGTFTLPGLPSGTGFMVKFTGDTGVYVPTYTGFMLSTVDMTSPRSFNLFTPNELSYWGVTSGNGVIRGRVMNGANQTAGYVSGATVSYASFLGITYTVKYENNEGILTTGTGTSANGKYYILNVAEGDTVTVSAAHPYYSFPQPRQFATHGAAAHQGLVNGVAVSGRVAIGGHIMNTADPAAGIKGATIEQFGAASPINATTSNLDGAFYLSVPATTTLQLKFSKPKDTTLAPTYSANMSFGADNLAVGDYNLFLKTILSNSVASGGWGVTPGKGIIRARVKDQAGNYLGGATVTAQGVSKSYAVCYDNACTLEATPDTGRYIVKDVDDGDTVTVTAQKQGWTFNTRFLPTHADSVHQGSVTGTPAAATTHPEAAAIQTRFEAAMAAFNANDFTGFASYVSAGYLDRGLNKDQFVAEAQQERTAHGVKSWTIQSITGAENNAVMNILWNDGYIDTMYFRKEGDVWLLYGNQKLFDVWANSGHEMYSTNPYLYWVSLQVKDPDSSLGVTISGVHVTGPGLPAGGIDLYHNTSDQQWHSWSQNTFEQDLSPKWATAPAVPLDYVFTISYTGGTGTSPEIQTFQVKTVVNVAPLQASLTPAAGSTATRPLTFSWGSAGTGYRYGVEVNDANYNRIWSAYDLTGTSVVYSGPALGGGQYIYHLLTQDGFGNMSMISTPFQMPLLYLKGDLDGNEAVNLADAILAMKVVSGLTPTIRANYDASGADVNNDAKVGLQELLYILQYLYGLRG
ncbi:MAG: dockerin type I repeat-containing protein, partial [Proteobacteria bacterium]|nr:dockerin type I repeat-containing protein [Pseudomonadota bacterium]